MKEATNTAGETKRDGLGSTNDNSPTPTDNANKALRELWKTILSNKQWPEAIPQLWPIQYCEMEPDRLLFVGLNPSQTDDNDVPLRIQNLQDLDNNTTVLEREARALGNNRGNRHRYFRIFDHFFPQANQEDHPREWNHIDLLAVRHTNQKEVTSALNLNRGLTQNSFGWKQAQIALQLASDLKPICIVVVNAFAANLMMPLLKEEPYSLRWDESCGHHWVTLANRIIPCFFSGMITGRRALDTYSRRRLIWHVGIALRGASKSK